MQSSKWLLLPALLSIAVLIPVRSLHAASSCPGDINGDHSVSIDEVVSVVNAALGICEASPSAGLLTTGQDQCDAGDGTLGACPGSPLGQDGAVHAGTPFSYTDNGDGTIQDNVTGLMWEKLSNDDSIHDLDTTYTWNHAFSEKIAALNMPPCFANHCDWRLPNRRELESLVDVGRVPAGVDRFPAINAAFDTNCEPGCTVTTCSCTLSEGTDYFWTSSSYRDIPGTAWAVNFHFGEVDGGFDKGNPDQAQIPYSVRAVRGGL